MLVRFLRDYRGLYLVATVFALIVQIPLTLPEVFRIGTERYKREIRDGIVGAFKTAWGN